MITETTPDGGTPFLAPFAESVQTALRPFSLGDLLDKRDAMRAELAMRYGNGALLDRMAGNDRDAALALTQAIEGAHAPFRTAAARRKVKQFRTLCLYIHAREKMGAPNASPASPASPAAPAPKATQAALFDTAETTNTATK